MSTSNDKTTSWGVAAALGAAIAASACCTIPLLLLTLGVGGAWIGTLTALAPFRPLFIALALGALGYAGYREWRTARGPDCDCEVRVSDRLRRGLLVVGVLAVTGLIASPWLIQGTASADSSLPAATTAPSMMQEVVLEVEGMTCAACNVTVQKALANLDGVQAATVTFEPPQAVVLYDPARVAPEVFVRATTDVGYPATVRSPSVAPVAVALRTPDKQQAHYTIQGPFCSGCVPGLKTLLEEVEGVETVEIDVEKLRVSITFDPAHTSAEALLAYINEETTFDLKLDEVTDLPDDA